MLRQAVAASVLCLALVTHSARAELHCPAPAHDAGTVRTGKPIRHRFVLVNRGREVVDITAVKPGCGCMQPQLDRVTLAPGEQANLDVEVNTVTQAARLNAWRTTVSFREGDKETELELQLTANLVAEIGISPA